MIVIYPIVWILYYNLFHYSPFIDILDISIFIFLFLKGVNEEEKEKTQLWELTKLRMKLKDRKI